MKKLFRKIGWKRPSDFLFDVMVVLATIAGLILLSSLPAFAESPGTSAVNFLKIGTGAKGSAMGEAQAAVTEDVNASYWNPAGLARVRFQEISLMHYELVEGIRYQQAVYGRPTPKYGTFAGGVSLLDYGSIQGYSPGGLPTGSVEASNLLLTASWAKQFSEKSKLSGGASLKYLRSDLAGFKASVPMVDLGVLYPFDWGRLHGLRLAGTVRNLGPKIKYDRTGSPLPRQLVIGSGLSALGGNLNIALDIVSPSDNDPYLATGIEYQLFDIVKLRAGYNGLSKFIGDGVTYGMGLQFNNWNIDYALVPFGDLGSTNRISVGVRFGRAMEIHQAEEQVELAFRDAQRRHALGKSVQAYSSLSELLLIAPWHKPSAELKAKIEKQFAEMSASKNAALLEAALADEFTRAKGAFDRDELVEAKKGFETILRLQPTHVGSKVYLERIENRYASLAQDSFKEGMAYYAAGDYAKAIPAFEKTLTIKPDHADAQAQLEKAKQMQTDATAQAEEMKRLAGAGDAYKAGLEAFQKNDFETALAKFDEVTKLAPEYEEVTRYYNLTKSSLAGILFEQSQVHFENGQLAESVAKLKRALELNPEDTRLKPALEIAERDLGVKNAQESRRLYQEGLEAYLGGASDKAEGLWKRALELDSTNDDALKALTKLEEQKRAKPTE